MPAIQPGQKISMKTNNNGPKQNQNDMHEFAVESELGSGVFGGVYEIKDANDQRFALKVIKLQSMPANARATMLQLIESEVRALRLMGYLHGFEQDGDQIRILMKFFKGRSAAVLIRECYDRHNHTGHPFGNPEYIRKRDAILKECKDALENVHAHNLTHNDPGMLNFLIDQETNKAALIDFGLATEGNTLNQRILDNFVLMNKFQAPIADDQLNFMPIPIQPDFAHIKFYELYMQPAFEYMKEHKIETGLTILAYGMFSIAAIYGIGTSALMHTFCMNLLTSYAKDQLTDTAFAFIKQQRFAFLQANHAPKIFNKIYNSLGMTAESYPDPDKDYSKTIFKVAIAINVLSKLYYRFDTATNLVKAAQAVMKGEISLSDVYNSAETMTEVAKAPLLFFPAKRLYSSAKDYYDRNIKSEQTVINSCEKEAYGRSFCRI